MTTHSRDPASCSSRTLANGMRVLERDLAGPLFHVRAAVQVGFDDEDADTLQAAHFLEHMLAKYTSSKYPSSKKNSAFLASVGATTNASTSSWETDYFIEAPVDEASRVLRLMTHALCDFRLDTEVVQSEGNSVREELKMRWIDNVFYEGDTARSNWLYGDHVRAQTGEAHVANVANLLAEPSRLTHFYRTHYLPRRMVVVVVGPLGELRRRLDRMYARLQSLPAGEPAPPRRALALPPPAHRAFPSPKATSTKVTLRW